MVEPRSLSRLFDQLIATADVRRIRFHELRHTYASLLLAQGVPARVVVDVLGHSQIAITTDLYSYVMPTALLEAADAIDQALRQANEPHGCQGCCQLGLGGSSRCEIDTPTGSG